MRVTRRRLVLISDRANDVPLPGSRAANTQAADIYAHCVPGASRARARGLFMKIYLAPRRTHPLPPLRLNKFRGEIEKEKGSPKIFRDFERKLIALRRRIAVRLHLFRRLALRLKISS